MNLPFRPQPCPPQMCTCGSTPCRCEPIFMDEQLLECWRQISAFKKMIEGIISDIGIGVGPVGPQGPQGVEGPAGAVGAAGPAGPQGAPGANGPSGPAGAVGPQGPSGLEVAYVGPTAPANPVLGELWIRTPDNSLHVWEGATLGWIDISAGGVGVIGPAGPAGPAGAAGPQGPQGIQGVAGAVGAVGPAGPQGAVGPIGAQGPGGPAGPQGATGPPGAAGGTVSGGRVQLATGSLTGGGASSTLNVLYNFTNAYDIYEIDVWDISVAGALDVGQLWMRATLDGTRWADLQYVKTGDSGNYPWDDYLFMGQIFNDTYDYASSVRIRLYFPWRTNWAKGLSWDGQGYWCNRLDGAGTIRGGTGGAGIGPLRGLQFGMSSPQGNGLRGAQVAINGIVK